jgi:hypothetical protein
MTTTRTVECKKVSVEGKARYVIDGRPPAFAEEIALYVYGKDGYQGLWAENDYWWEIMALLFWDIIYARLPDVWTPQFGEFPSALQDMPQDFFQPEFYQRREQLIHQRMASLREADIEREIISALTAHRGKPCRPVEKWDKFSAGDLAAAARVLSRDQLVAIMHRLLSDFRTNRSGFPDLFLWKDTTPLFVEVKGARARVSEGQAAWHTFLSEELQLLVEVCEVRSSSESRAKAERPKMVVTVRFGASTSQHREAAIEHAKKQKTYSVEGEGKTAVHCVEFDMKDADGILRMLDLTRGWKSQEVSVNGEPVEPGELRYPLNCYQRRQRSGQAQAYCRNLEYTSERSPWGCHQFRFQEIESGHWRGYGRFDAAGVWHFDKDEIRLDVEEQISRLRYCPAFDPGRVFAVIDNLPDSVDPTADPGWEAIYSWGATQGSPPEGIRRLKSGERKSPPPWEEREIVIQIPGPSRSKQQPVAKGAGCALVTAILLAAVIAVVRLVF